MEYAKNQIADTDPGSFWGQLRQLSRLLFARPPMGAVYSFAVYSFYDATNMAQDSDNLVWIDLEMTGLDTERDRIIEIATLITDRQLNTLAEGPVLAIRQDDEILAQMDAWNVKQHGKSGLLERVYNSRIDEGEAEIATLAFLRQYVPPNASPMCGNSVCQDRRFLARTMPALEAYFHYRNLDVSTLKELASRWAPQVARGFTKDSTHRALDDIRDSIEELKYYREHLLRV
jgi:oligoribonuclease